jgi:hypothetical protein
MSTPIIEVDEFTGSVIAAEAGDPRTAGSVLAATQPLANRTRFIRERARGVIDQGRYIVPLNDPFWKSNFSTINGPFVWQQTSVGSTADLIFALDTLPTAGSVIDQLTVRFKPASGHGALPASQPILEFWRQANDGSGFGELVDDAQLAAGSVVAYEAQQTLNLTFGTPHAISASHTYYVRFEGESGANAVTGLYMVRLEAVMSPE